MSSIGSECAGTAKVAATVAARRMARSMTRPPAYRSGRRALPALDHAVERVALHRRLAERADDANELVRRRAVRGAGGRDDVLLDHHRAEVVRAERERDLADLHALRDPRGLDVVDVVEVDPAHRLCEQVVERGRPGLARNDAGE